MSDTAKATIVSIDDDPIILNSLLSILKPHYDVKPFSSGKAALKFLASHSADLILLDHNMPEMTGFDVLERLEAEERTRHTAVIFLTGSEDGDCEVQALEKGVADYILKPIKPKVLTTRVRQQLELQRYRQHLEKMVEQKTENLRQAYNQLKIRENTTLSLLAKATDMRDHGTGDHIWRTTEFVRILTQALLENPTPRYELDPGKAEDIISSSKLHDLGKIAMPDTILGKLGKLTPEEYEVVKLHPLQGADLLDEFIVLLGSDSFLNTARDIAVSHHEKWNGSGYPHGLEGADIPLAGRIVAIADVYDALISVRPYKKSFSHEEAVGIIVNDSGKHFDPHLVEVFLSRVESFRALYNAAVSKTAILDPGTTM